MPDKPTKITDETVVGQITLAGCTHPIVARELHPEYRERLERYEQILAECSRRLTRIIALEQEVEAAEELAEAAKKGLDALEEHEADSLEECSLIYPITMSYLRTALAKWKEQQP